MNKKISLFLDNICMHINYKPVHKEIREELTCHIVELSDEYMLKGSTEEEALDLAIADMGDCDEIGCHLNKQHKPQTEWALIAFTSIIAVIGGIIMFASSKFESHQAVDFNRYLLFAAIGIAIMAALYFFDYTKLKKLALPIYLFTFAALIFTICSGSFLLSPDYATLLFLISFAGFMDRFKNKGGIAIAYLMGIGGISLLPIMMMPRFPQALILLAGYGVLTFSAVNRGYFGGNRRKQLFSLSAAAATGAVGLAVGIVSVPYRLQKITSFITRGKSDPLGGGWQQAMADNWLAVSKLFGKTTETVSGYGLDMAMPGATTDYVLINVIATLGWAAGIALVALAALFIIRMYLTIKKVKNDYGYFLSCGACTVLSMQFIIGILMNFNLFPLMGVSIPFISYGGIGYVVSSAFVGIILSVWRRNNLIMKTDKPVLNNRGKFIVFEDGKLIINFK